MAVRLALQPLIDDGSLSQGVLRNQIVAISVGLVNGVPMLDLAYAEDVMAEVDLNVVMTATGKLVEIQGTAEKTPFERRHLDQLVDLAAGGIQQLAGYQLQVLSKR